MLVLLILAFLANDPKCSVRVWPQVGLAPVRYVRVQVITETRQGGELVLVGETSTQVNPGARATLVEWKNLTLGEGDYEVIWATPGCTARAALTVH